MLNKEKFANEIIEAAIYGGFALKDGIPISCNFNRCCDCDWNNKPCHQERLTWANSECVEEPVDPHWEIDTKILVSDDKNMWFKRHYAGFDEKAPYPFYTWDSGKTSWTASGVKGGFKYAKFPEDE